ncbi:MAG: HAMP domain-containing methyl-accepting chemotaxis protein, partial [Acidobacteriota bacterium]
VFINVSSRQKQEPYLVIWGKMNADMLSAISELEKTIYLKEDRQAVALTKRILADYQYGFNDIFNQIQANKIDQAQQANDAMDKYRWAANKLEDIGKQLAEESEKRSLISEAEVSRQIKQAEIVLLVAFLLTIIFSLLIGIFLTRSVTRPILQAVDVARSVAQGNLKLMLNDNPPKNEVGKLLESMGVMVNSLDLHAKVAQEIATGNLEVVVEPRSSADSFGKSFKLMVEKLREAVITIRNAANQISGVSREIFNASQLSSRLNKEAACSIERTGCAIHQMNVNTRNIVKSTQEQVTMVTEASNRIEEILLSIEEIAIASEKLLLIAEKLQEEVLVGVCAVEKNTEGILKINNSLHSFADTINALQERTNNIGKITEVLAEISNQTNLLALNAGIEAARAGAYGKGFSVIATEVHKLSEHSANCTHEIGAIINGIQKEVSHAVGDMQRSNKIADEGIVVCQQVSAALTRIKESVAEVYQCSHKIGTASTNQRSNTKRVADATAILNTLTLDISIAIEEQALGAKEILEAIDKLSKVINQNTEISTGLAIDGKKLSDQSHLLQGLLGQFQLRDGSEYRNTIEIDQSIKLVEEPSSTSLAKTLSNLHNNNIEKFTNRVSAIDGKNTNISVKRNGLMGRSSR